MKAIEGQPGPDSRFKKMWQDCQDSQNSRDRTAQPGQDDQITTAGAWQPVQGNWDTDAGEDGRNSTARTAPRLAVSA